MGPRPIVHRRRGLFVTTVYDEIRGAFVERPLAQAMCPDLPAGAECELRADPARAFCGGGTRAMHSDGLSDSSGLRSLPKQARSVR